MSELFDYKKAEDPKKPTAPQMRFLHALAGRTLEIRSHPTHSVWLKTEAGEPVLYFFHLAVANNVVLNGWAELKTLKQGKAEYRISKSGREALKELCAHTHNPHLPNTSEVLAGNLICKKCAHSIRCRSKQPTAHGANFWDAQYGPMCDKCLDYLNSDRSMK